MDLVEIEARFKKEIDAAIQETHLPCEVCFSRPAQQMVFLCEERMVTMAFVCQECKDHPETFVSPDGEPIAEKIHFKDLANKS